MRTHTNTKELLIKNEIRKIKPKKFLWNKVFYYSSYKELEINIFSQKNHSKLLFLKEQLIDTNQYTLFPLPAASLLWPKWKHKIYTNPQFKISADCWWPLYMQVYPASTQDEYNKCWMSSKVYWLTRIG